MSSFVHALLDGNTRTVPLADHADGNFNSFVPKKEYPGDYQELAPSSKRFVEAIFSEPRVKIRYVNFISKFSLEEVRVEGQTPQGLEDTIVAAMGSNEEGAILKKLRWTNTGEGTCKIEGQKFAFDPFSYGKYLNADQREKSTTICRLPNAIREESLPDLRPRREGELDESYRAIQTEREEKLHSIRRSYVAFQNNCKELIRLLEEARVSSGKRREFFEDQASLVDMKTSWIRPRLFQGYILACRAEQEFCLALPWKMKKRIAHLFDQNQLDIDKYMKKFKTVASTQNWIAAGCIQSDSNGFGSKYLKFQEAEDTPEEEVAVLIAPEFKKLFRTVLECYIQGLNRHQIVHPDVQSRPKIRKKKNNSAAGKAKS